MNSSEDSDRDPSWRGILCQEGPENPISNLRFLSKLFRKHKLHSLKDTQKQDRALETSESGSDFFGKVNKNGDGKLGRERGETRALKKEKHEISVRKMGKMIKSPIMELDL